MDFLMHVNKCRISEKSKTSPVDKPVAFPMKSIEPFVKSVVASECVIGSVISLGDGTEAMYVPYLLYYRIINT
jgi:hypothetical protein